METKRKLANQSYYKVTVGVGESNVADYGVELMINCCGEAVIRSEWAHQRDVCRKDYYLIYSLGGELTGHIGGESRVIKSGDAVCISPGTPYRFATRSPLDEWTHYYWVHFTGREAETVIAQSGLATNKIYSLGSCDEAFVYYEKLFAEFRTQGRDFEYSAALQLRYLLYVFGRAAAKSETGRLDRSIRYIHTHLRYELTVEALAAMEYLGVSRYRELFKGITGLSPNEYVTQLRIERAKDLLSGTDNSISEIAEGVGYENRNYFHNLFKRRVGMSPGEYRSSFGSRDGK